MEKTYRKPLLVVVAMVAVAAISVAGTLAYLTASTEEVKNTFSAGGLVGPESVFTLDESKATADENNPGTYTLDTTERVKENSYEAVVPGVDVPKDPKVTIEKLEANAYLFLEVDGSTMPDTLTWAIDDSQWTELTGVTPKHGTTVYAHNAAIAAGAASTEYNVLKDAKIVVDGDYEAGASEEALEFWAYLTQSAGFDNATEAWNATWGASTTNP